MYVFRIRNYFIASCKCLGFQIISLWPSKTIRRHLKAAYSIGFTFVVLTVSVYRPHFFTNLLPFSFRKSIKKTSKIEAAGFLDALRGRSESILGLLGSRKMLKRASGSVLEPSWGRLGRVVGASWEARKPSWGCLDTFWTLLRLSQELQMLLTEAKHSILS